MERAAHKTLYDACHRIVQKVRLVLHPTTTLSFGEHFENLFGARPVVDQTSECQPNVESLEIKLFKL